MIQPNQAARRVDFKQILMPLHLKYKASTRVPVEIEGLLPTWTRGKPLSEIERFEIFHGNQKIPLAELFEVAGDAADAAIVFDGDLAGVHWIGSGMSEGSIHVEGDAGRHLGSRMTGGLIRVQGDCGDFAGTSMHGGRIHVGGNAGDSLGSASPGSPRGMTGGCILVDGNVGDETGRAMRRGLVAVGGSAGDFSGAHMLAGSVLIFGSCGARPGAGMRRGTIAALGGAPTSLLPTFRHACLYQPYFLRLTLTHLCQLGFAVPPDLLECSCDLYHGDMLELGRGEILVRKETSQSLSSSNAGG